MQHQWPSYQTSLWRSSFGGWTLILTGGTISSWSGGTTNIGFKTSVCRRPHSRICVPGLPLPYNTRTLTCGPSLPWRSGSLLPCGSWPPLNSYRLVGHQFVMGRSTVGGILMEVVRAINSELLHRIVHLRHLNTITAELAGLEFLNCGGALNGTHIPICAPAHQTVQYINRKGYFSMVLQALANHQGQFTDICVGCLGWAHDTCIFVTPNCTTGCSLERSSCSGTLRSGTYRGRCVSWPTRPTPLCPGS